MSEPKYKLGDDGELEEIIEDFGEKPKCKRKPKYYVRTLQIPLSLMLVLSASILILVLITFGILRPPPMSVAPKVTVSLSPTQTPFEWLGQLSLCNSSPITQKARFAYQTGSPNGNELVEVDANGTNPCLLTQNMDIDDNQPSWSPDGSKITFVRPNYGTRGSAIYVMDADGRNIRKVTGNFDVVAFPSWSPDGNKIVFSGNLTRNQDSEIYIINADGTNLVNLTQNPLNDFSPNWSYDGQWIVFVSDRTYPDKVRAGVERPDGNEIYVISPNGGNLRQLTFNNRYDLSPRWSPDGEQIVFYSYENIYVMDKDGGNRRQLTTNGNMSIIRPFWMPDGKEVGFTSDSNPSIQFVNVRSGETRTLRVIGNPTFISPWFASS